MTGAPEADPSDDPPFEYRNYYESKDEQEAIEAIQNLLFATQEQDSDWATPHNVDEDGAIIISDSEGEAAEVVPSIALDTPAEHPFRAAAEDFLRSQPANTHHIRRPGDPEAYVVFKGRIPGVYLTW